MVVSALAAWQPSLSLSLASFPVASAAAEAGPAGAVPNGYGELLMMSLGLLAVIGVLAVVAMKVLGAGKMGRRRGDLLEVIARQPLEPRRSLYVVRAGTRTLLVGTSELGVTMLTELEGVDALDGVTRRPPQAQAGAGFGELVREATRRWSGRKTGKSGLGAGTVDAGGAGGAGGAGSGSIGGEPPELGPS